MFAPNDDFPPHNGALPEEPDTDELVERLRMLAWPQVPDEVRERCWAHFRRAVGAADPDQDRFGRRRDRSSRMDFSRRAPVPPANRLAGAATRPTWSARPVRGLAGLV